MAASAATRSTTVAIAGLVLAAGKGTRMRSETPKVLHKVAGRPMLGWVLKALETAGVASTCVVLSEERDGFGEFLRANPELRVAVQKNRAGTGDAAAAAAWSFAGAEPAPYAAGGAVQGAPIVCEHVLIAAGDVPAVRGESLRTFVDAYLASGADVGVLGMRVPEPKGYGRLVTRGPDLLAIVEEKDADAETKRIDVCNTGVLAVRREALFALLHALTPNNAQGEYYLTDIVQHARARSLKTMAHVTDAWREFAGINDRAQLAAVEEFVVERRRAELMAAGVSLRLPSSIYLEADVEVGADSELGPHTTLRAGARLGRGVVVGAGATVERCQVGDGAHIGAGAVVAGGAIPAGTLVPPLTVRLI